MKRRTKIILIIYTIAFSMVLLGIIHYFLNFDEYDTILNDPRELQDDQ